MRSLERAIDLDPLNSLHTAADCAQLSSSAPLRRGKNRFWTVRWLSIQIMSISNSSVRPWNSIGKLIHVRCVEWSIQFAPQIPPPLETSRWGEYWLGSALAERDAAAARNAVIAAGENPAFTDETVEFSRPFMEGVIARMTKDDAAHVQLSPRRTRSSRASFKLPKATARRSACWV